MDLAARLLYRLTYDRVAYEPIREDFLTWYWHVYHDLSLDDEMDRDVGELIQMAAESRSEAINYEPDTKLNTAIEVVDEVNSIVKRYAVYSTALGVSIGVLLVGTGVTNIYSTILGESLSRVLSALASGIGVASVVIPGSALPAYYLLKDTVNTNSELIRLFNEELVISPGRIREHDREPDRLTCFYIWNSGLCSTTKVSSVMILGIIRTVSPTIYGIISTRLQKDISEYFDDNFWKMMGKEYQRVRSQLPYFEHYE